MAVLDDIAEFGIKFVFHLIIENVFFYTGEIILYIVTFGWKKPRLVDWILFLDFHHWVNSEGVAEVN